MYPWAPLSLSCRNGEPCIHSLGHLCCQWPNRHSSSVLTPPLFFAFTVFLALMACSINISAQGFLLLSLQCATPSLVSPHTCSSVASLCASSGTPLYDVLSFLVQREAQPSFFLRSCPLGCIHPRSLLFSSLLSGLETLFSSLPCDLDIDTRPLLFAP